MEDKNNYYFMGKFFETFEDLLKYEAIWKDAPLNQENATIMGEVLVKDIVMNAMLGDNPMTNQEFQKKLNDVFDEFIKVMRGKNK